MHKNVLQYNQTLTKKENNTMKKFINMLSVLLALTMCLGIVVACAKDEDKGSEGGATTPAETTTTVALTTTTTPAHTTTAGTTHIEDTYNPNPTGTVPADGMIKNAADLHAVLVNGESNKDYTVTATEIDMAGLKWVGMKDYSGTFDFGGCVVKNVSFPMFTSVTGGTVKNLVVSDSTQEYTNEESEADKDLIVLSSSDTQCRVYGGVIRFMSEGVVSNITVESSVSIKAEMFIEEAKVGGIVGYANGDNLLIENCTFKGAVSTDSLSVYIAGIVSHLESSNDTSLNVDDPASSSVLIKGCTNYGTVDNYGFGNDSKVAGVVGALGTGAAYKCANYGTISSNDKGHCSGVVGYCGNKMTIMYCFNAGTILGCTVCNAGIAAYSRGEVRRFIGCINVGTITVKEGNSSNYICGIIGWIRNQEYFESCYNLKSACEKWGLSKTEIDPANPETYATEYSAATLENCANLDSVDAILAAMEAQHPGVFVKDGNSIKLAD